MSSRVQPITVDAAPWSLEDPIPRVCFKEDVCRILRLSMRQLEKLLAAGTLPLVELAPLDSRPRFTGGSVRTIASGRWSTNDIPSPAARPHRTPAVDKPTLEEARA